MHKMLESRVGHEDSAAPPAPVVGRTDRAMSDKKVMAVVSQLETHFAAFPNPPRPFGRWMETTSISMWIGRVRSQSRFDNLKWWCVDIGLI